MKNLVVLFGFALGSIGTLMFITFPTVDPAVYLPTTAMTTETLQPIKTPLPGNGDRFQCAPSLSKEIGDLPPVFIFMPAKAGGTSVKNLPRSATRMQLV